jgi:hypothetical protein
MTGHGRVQADAFFLSVHKNFGYYDSRKRFLANHGHTD